MSNLHDILWNTTNEQLMVRVKLLGVKPSPPNKANLIDIIKAAFAEDGLRTQWDSLSELEQAAVAEASYAPDLRFCQTPFEAKYGSAPPFYISSEDSSMQHYRQSSNVPTRLNLFLYDTAALEGITVPADLAERVRQIAPEPPPSAVASSTEPPTEKDLYIRLTEHEALSEVTALLRLADQGDLRVSDKTGIPSAAGRARIIDCLANGDFFPPEIAYHNDPKSRDEEIGAMKPVAWSHLLLAAKYVSVAATKSKLLPAGVRALKQEPHTLIRELWRKWLNNTIFDEFNRIGAIKGQSAKRHMTAKPPRRLAISEALEQCPVGRWIETTELSRYMLATDLEFEITSNPWKLYLAEAHYGSLGYSGCGGWNILQFRYILCLLFEYAATLGLIDIAFVHPGDGLDDFRSLWGADDLEWLSRYDGLRAFRITPLGAFCLGLEDDFKPSRPLSSLKLTVQPNLQIHQLSGTLQAAERFMLDAWAEPLGDGVWRLDPTRGRDAVERGQSAADFATLLQQYDLEPLPENVIGFLKSCESAGTAVRSAGDALLFDCRDAATADLISTSAELRDLYYRCSSTRLAVPAAHAVRFRKAIRALGLGIV